jgi:hypothetical protein
MLDSQRSDEKVKIMKKAGTISGPGSVLAGCPDKSKVSRGQGFDVKTHSKSLETLNSNL